MKKTKDIILKLKKARNEKGLSYRNILALMEKNGDYLSKSTLSRVFSKESEEMSFRYEETICPIAKVLIDTDIIKIEDGLKNTNGKVLPEYIKELKEHMAGMKERMILFRLSSIFSGQFYLHIKTL